jgi:hypothetical protein
MAENQITITAEKLAELEKILLNTSGNASLAQRFRALFTLKAIGKSDERVVGVIGKGTHIPLFSMINTLLKFLLTYRELVYRLRRSIGIAQTRTRLRPWSNTTTKRVAYPQ